jgi:hypothetical protein
MIASLRIAASHRRIAGTSARFVAPAALALSAASCVPATISRMPAVHVDHPLSMARDAQVPPGAMAEPLQPTVESFARNAAIPVATAPNPAARAISFDGRTPIDGLRSLHCLAEAVYYEARSEGWLL